MMVYIHAHAGKKIIAIERKRERRSRQEKQLNENKKGP
jgi:hypothetical protein